MHVADDNFVGGLRHGRGQRHLFELSDGRNVGEKVGVGDGVLLNQAGAVSKALRSLHILVAEAVVKDAKSPAKHGFGTRVVFALSRRPGKSEARRPVVLVVNIRLHFIAQPQTQSQVGLHAPIVSQQYVISPAAPHKDRDQRREHFAIWHRFLRGDDARTGVTTGISAYDRARTIQVAIDPATQASDLARPGHVFPLRARKGGVLVRAGQTEASVDLARLAGLIPAGIICEIMKDDGTMARVPDLIEFCRQHDMKMLTVAELIRYRMAHERYVHRVGEALVGTRFGEFRLIAYESEVDGGESHVALIRGEVENSETPVLVRMHAHCLMGDVFGATGCECHATLEGSLRRIADEGRGALIYLHQTSQAFRSRKSANAARSLFIADASCHLCSITNVKRSAKSESARRFCPI